MAAPLLAAACAPGPVAGPPRIVGAADFESRIARLEQVDPQSPEALNARLEYADFLSEPASESGSGDCRKRLDSAQAQFDVLAARPALRVLLQLGPARLASGAYKIHAARADCDPANRQSELQQALEAARIGISLYRDALDYQSAAVMQFNVAVTEHALGDEAAAVRELRAAIAMDREFGFRDDAQDNTQLLLRWTKAADADARLSEAMKDFPARRLEFKFGWSSGDADVAITAEDTSLVRGKPVQSHGDISLKRRINGGSSGWTVSDDPGVAHYQLSDWPGGPDKSQWAMLCFLSSNLLQAPTIKVARNGDFDTVTDAKDFGNKLAVQLSPPLDQISPSDPAWLEATARDVKAAFSPEFLEYSAEMAYGIETGTWIGAKLEQGLWYQMTAPLFLPALGLGHYIANQDISFAFTRRLPCTADAPSHLCAEIVLHVTPTADTLKATIEQVNSRLKVAAPQSAHYWTQTCIRLVIDPVTLLPYVRDVRQFWFGGVDGTASARSDPMIEQMRAVSTVSYH